MAKISTVLGICGGSGVNLFPFLDSKIQILGNLEPRTIFKDPQYKQWNSNFADVPVYYDGVLKTFDKPVDVIIGAPDCGHSSILALSRNKVFGNPKENKSLSFFIESIRTYKPKVFFMENLEALLKTYGRKDLKKAFKGYKLKFFPSSVSCWGNSQITRHRLIIIGVREDLKLRKHFNLVSGESLKAKTCKELLKGLRKPDLSLGHMREPLDTMITIYSKKKISAREIQQGWLSSNASRWSVKGRNFTTAPGVYRNLDDSFPATARKANRQYNQRGLMMTPRELGRIQGLPDHFIIYMEKENVRYWINKGRMNVTKCPPFEVGVWFKTCLEIINSK